MTGESMREPNPNQRLPLHQKVALGIAVLGFSLYATAMEENPRLNPLELAIEFVQNKL